jgi:hypothetical protein
VSLQFSRSIRSLEVDNYRAAKIGMILAVIVAAALLAWFLLARVTVYEISSDVEYTGDGRLAAHFPSETAKRIQPGQSAVLRIDTIPDGKILNLPALVIGVDRQSELVELIILADEAALGSLDPDITGQVEVEVEYITPAALVRRASGSYLNNTEFPVSPQSLENEGE